MTALCLRLCTIFDYTLTRWTHRSVSYTGPMSLFDLEHFQKQNYSFDSADLLQTVSICAQVELFCLVDLKSHPFKCCYFCQQTVLQQEKRNGCDHFINVCRIHSLQTENKIYAASLKLWNTQKVTV